MMPQQEEGFIEDEDEEFIEDDEETEKERLRREWEEEHFHSPTSMESLGLTWKDFI